MGDRGRIGTLLAATDHDDEAYLDFAEGLRSFTLGAVEPALRARARSAFEAFAAAAGHWPASLEDAHRALDSLPIVAARNRLHRSAQEMMWDGVVATYEKRRAELEAALDAADQCGPGTVEYDPAFSYPAYFERVAFHLQPGSYHRDPLAGYFYHYGTKYLFTGDNDDDELQQALVDRVRLPADGVVRRVVDLGCAIGQSTTALKKRFPAAEVWGIDLAAPMVRYAHKRAVELGIPVHFAQRPAEETRFPGEAFDLAFAYILFHEIPIEVAQRVVREVHRILRPGGIFAVVDMMSAARHTSILQDYNREYFAAHNAEPYSLAWVRADFTGMLKAAGFRAVEERPSGVTISWLWEATR
ncbi:MAG: methyltransferase domain-containing protein [Chloroflexota bacterium]|nr:methyltransferase domain-containing protein [Dehalococcoidia bacterium]MDW8253434.1 methyltransferase domain-containing protein [Chloroflexota bacterium]